MDIKKRQIINFFLKKKKVLLNEQLCPTAFRYIDCCVKITYTRACVCGFSCGPSVFEGQFGLDSGFSTILGLTFQSEA